MLVLMYERKSTGDNFEHLHPIGSNRLLSKRQTIPSYIYIFAYSYHCASFFLLLLSKIIY